MHEITHPTFEDRCIISCGILHPEMSLVSCVSDQLPPGFIRVSIGAPEDNDALLVAYKETHETYG